LNFPALPFGNSVEKVCGRRTFVWFGGVEEHGCAGDNTRGRLNEIV
jgi:hypothetical protein